MIRRITVAVAASLISICGFAAISQTAHASTEVAAQVLFVPPGCAVEANLGAEAWDFIERCRLGSILREFPSDYLYATLAQIKVDRTTKGRKAWKLLTDGRFAKP